MVADIVFSLNKKIWLSLIVAINSIAENAKTPENVRCNILVPPGEKSFFEEKIQTHLPALSVQWRVKEYLPPEFLRTYLDKRFKEKTEDRRNSRQIQYSRFFFKDAWPDLSAIVYIDTDLIVLGDIAELHGYTQSLDKQCYFGSIPHFYPNVFYFSNPFKVWNEIFQFEKTFNAGVWFTDLSFWNDETYQRLDYYLDLDAQNNYQLYSLGDEPVFNLMFKHYLQVEKNWNRCGYGSFPLVTKLLLDTSPKMLEQAKLIHWSGPLKPWNSPKVAFADAWRSYLPESLQDSIEE
ncbi:MAG: glycosyltransferase [Cyanobacteria bacterium P01_F01_bin.3]